MRVVAKNPASRVTVRSRTLGRRLRIVRERRQISGRALSLRLGWPHTNISFYETGSRTPKIEDVGAILAALHVVGKEREEILELARNAAEPQWQPDAPEALMGLIECESAATRIVEWSHTVVPGLLQTAEYARAILLATGMPDDQIKSRLAMRMNRRKVLERPNPVPYLALIGDFALREPICPAEVMQRQREHLVKMSRRSNVDIRIVRSGIGWHPGLAGPFVLYTFSDQDPVVHNEHYRSGAFNADPRVSRDYFAAVDKLVSLAETPEASREMIRSR